MNRTVLAKLAFAVQRSLNLSGLEQPWLINFHDSVGWLAASPLMLPGSIMGVHQAGRLAGLQGARWPCSGNTSASSGWCGLLAGVLRWSCLAGRCRPDQLPHVVVPGQHSNESLLQQKLQILLRPSLGSHRTRLSLQFAGQSKSHTHRRFNRWRGRLHLKGVYALRWEEFVAISSWWRTQTLEPKTTRVHILCWHSLTHWGALGKFLYLCAPQFLFL